MSQLTFTFLPENSFVEFEECHIKDLTLSDKVPHIVLHKAKWNPWIFEYFYCFVLLRNSFFVAYTDKQYCLKFDSAVVSRAYFWTCVLPSCGVPEMNLQLDQGAGCLFPSRSHYHNFDSALLFSVTLTPLSASLPHLPLLCFFSPFFYLPCITPSLSPYSSPSSFIQPTCHAFQLLVSFLWTFFSSLFILEYLSNTTV